MAVNSYSRIVPDNIQTELKRNARSESDALWLIADRALSVYERVKRLQDAGVVSYMDVQDGDIWRAVAYYAEKSPARVQGLARVAKETPSQLRANYQMDWGFGYFERLVGLEPEIDPWEVFAFLEQYKQGEITHPLPGRVLGVGEFLLIYESHILGKYRGENIPPQPGSGGIDLAVAGIRAISFMGILEAARKLKRQLFGCQDRPAVRRMLTLIEEIEAEMPEVMREMGYEVVSEKEKALDKQ